MKEKLLFLKCIPTKVKLFILYSYMSHTSINREGIQNSLTINMSRTIRQHFYAISTSLSDTREQEGHKDLFCNHQLYNLAYRHLCR